jgi:hypothetical protein
VYTWNGKSEILTLMNCPVLARPVRQAQGSFKKADWFSEVQAPALELSYLQQKF